MSRATVDERCGCGATFHYDVESPHYAERAATAWRAEHRHNDPAPAETTSADPGATARQSGAPGSHQGD